MQKASISDVMAPDQNKKKQDHHDTLKWKRKKKKAAKVILTPFLYSYIILNNSFIIAVTNKTLIWKSYHTFRYRTHALGSPYFQTILF